MLSRMGWLGFEVEVLQQEHQAKTVDFREVVVQVLTHAQTKVDECRHSNGTQAGHTRFEWGL